MSALLLASASPRRRELLSSCGLTLTVVAADVDESALPNEAPEALARRLAAKKARAVAERTSTPHPAILAADTIVVIREGDKAYVLGKPTDASDAHRMLTRLAGRTHEVITGYHLIHEGAERGRIVTTEVCFRALAEAEIDGYIATREWEGKAGGYAIQGIAGAFVRTLRGSYSNVVGLPLCEVQEDLILLGVLGNDWLLRVSAP